jgi:ABC-2 type transport system ATP-binding protein
MTHIFQKFLLKFREIIIYSGKTLKNITETLKQTGYNDIFISNQRRGDKMLLEFKNITKNFGDTKVLKGVSFSAKSGSAIGLLGRNGAGKTTLIRILMGVFASDSGEVLIDGKPIDRKNISIGYLPEERGLYPKKKIIDQLVFFAMLKGMKRCDAIREVNNLLSKLGIQEYRDRRLDTLSKGNQQKIQLITALVHNPDIIVLDEPFSGLDPVNALLLKNVIQGEIEKGKIVLFSSHQMNYIEEFCDSVAILHRGKVVLRGTLQEIKQSYPKNRLIVRSKDFKQVLSDENGILQNDGSVLITLKDDFEKTEKIKHLAENYDVDEISVCLPSLSDIFIGVAGEEDKK